MIKRSKEALPDAKIYWLINTELGEAIPQGIREACRHYGIEYIDFEHIEKIEGHPTPVGMTEIKNTIMSYLFN